MAVVLCDVQWAFGQCALYKSLISMIDSASCVGAVLVLTVALFLLLFGGSGSTPTPAPVPIRILLPVCPTSLLLCVCGLFTESVSGYSTRTLVLVVVLMLVLGLEHATARTSPVRCSLACLIAGGLPASLGQPLLRLPGEGEIRAARFFLPHCLSLDSGCDTSKTHKYVRAILRVNIENCLPSY